MRDMRARGAPRGAAARPPPPAAPSAGARSAGSRDASPGAPLPGGSARGAGRAAVTWPGRASRGPAQRGAQPGARGRRPPDLWLERPGPGVRAGEEPPRLAGRLLQGCFSRSLPGFCALQPFIIPPRALSRRFQAEVAGLGKGRLRGLRPGRAAARRKSSRGAELGGAVRTLPHTPAGPR